jgi:hypothetical protein
MDKLIPAFAPIFAAGFAVQQLLEIITSFLDLDTRPNFQKYKKPILGGVALALGCALASELANLGVLHTLKGVPYNASDPLFNILDFIVTALVISAGTEGVNSIMKFLKYAKEDKKREAAGADPQSASPGAGGPALTAVPAAVPVVNPPAPTEAALARVSRQ